MNYFQQFKKFIFPDDHRAENIKGIAKELSMTYSATDEFGLFRLLKDFKLFRKGHGKRITNILKEKSEFHETNISIFDYEYTQGHGKHAKTYQQTVFFIQSKSLDLPKFYLQPEWFFHRIANYFGINDIDFEEHPEFSDQYLLKSKEESRMRQKMTDEVIHFFTIEKDWYLEGVNYYLIVYMDTVLVPSKNISFLYEKGKEIVAMFTKK